MKGGVGCSIGCRCEGCKNAFGRKDGELYLNIFATFFLMNDNDYIERKQRIGPNPSQSSGGKTQRGREEMEMGPSSYKKQSSGLNCVTKNLHFCKQRRNPNKREKYTSL